MLSFPLSLSSFILISMSKITRADVDKLCQLARIGATDDEKDALASDLARIVEYVGQISVVEIPEDFDTRDVVVNVMREDVDPYAPKEFTEKILSRAPRRKDDFVQVQKVLGNNDDL